MDESLAEKYHSNSQRARVMTEPWIEAHMYCPRCHTDHVKRRKNNTPVDDFHCTVCGAEYELKSKSGRWGKSLQGGAYSKMIERITSDTNPDLFLLSYAKDPARVTDLTLIPKYFLTPSIVKKRKPLGPNAKRAGWVGCTVDLSKIPEQGKIAVIRDGVMLDPELVRDAVRRAGKLEMASGEARSWLLDVLTVVNDLGDEFTLEEVYSYEIALAANHPDNHHVRAKIRQQLQALRDRGVIEMAGNGQYRKL
ncbi:MAG: hypothetical protein IJI68_08780 [Eggerthellaceae bacterium]|nr:hypothetical protein [Eggerthellaceae bacterium]